MGKILRESELLKVRGLKISSYIGAKEDIERGLRLI